MGAHLVTGFAISITHSEMDEGTERRKVGSTEMLNNVDALALHEKMDANGKAPASVEVKVFNKKVCSSY